MGNNVESDCLRQGTALTDGNDISVLYEKGWGAVGGHVLVSLFETTVLSDVVQVVSSDDHRSLHLGRDDLSHKDPSPDGNVSSEGALLVHVVALHRRVGGLDAKAYVLHEAHGFLLGGPHSALPGDEDGILLLVGLFVLVALDVILRNSDHGFLGLYDPCWSTFQLLSATTNGMPAGKTNRSKGKTGAVSGKVRGVVDGRITPRRYD